MRSRLATFALASFLLISACSPSSVPPKSVRISHGQIGATAGAWDIYVGKEKGFFAAEGIDLDLLFLRSNTEVIQAIVGGSLQTGGPTPDAIINAIGKSADLSIVAGEFNRIVYSLMSSPQITTVAGLKGKSIGVSALKDGSTFLLKRILAAKGLGENDYDLRQVGSSAERFTALKVGAVSAVMLAQPQDFQITEEGFNRLLLSTDVIRDFQYNVITVRRDWAKANSEDLVRYLRALSKSARWLYDPKNRAEAIDILIKYTKSEPKYAGMTYDLFFGPTQVMSREGEINIEGMKTAIDIMGDTGELEKPLPAPEKFIDLSYYQKAMQK